MRPLASHDAGCVGCGRDNPGGLGLAFAVDEDGRVHAPLRFDDRHQGAPGFAHGGMVATALDDTLGSVLFVIGRPAVTARLTVDYRRPAFLHADHTVTGWADAVDGRKLHLRGELRDATGALVAEATALFLEVDVSHFAQNGSDVPDSVKRAWRAGERELPY